MLVKSVATDFLGMEIYIIRTIPKRSLGKKSELDWFKNQLRRNWTVWSEKHLGLEIDIGDEAYVVPLYPFLLVCVGVHKRSFTSQTCRAGEARGA